MKVDLFDFDLPEDRIALLPAEPRDSARMLSVNKGEVFDRQISDLPGLLRAGDILVLNDTKVIKAQLRGLRPAREAGGGGDVFIDVTLHKREEPDLWRAFVRPAKRLKVGDQLTFGEDLSALVTVREGAEAVLQFDQTGTELDAAIASVGAPPLPPYIARKRGADEKDEASYQTVYAREEGSVAAPTAGLHFTDNLLASIRESGVLVETITLHVGAGTFLPVAVDDTDHHKMHAEWGEITAEQSVHINAAREAGGRLIAVGTTSLRLLESAARKDGSVRSFAEETDIFITPGYKFRTADYLLTNFHLPRSTLFMLVCAFAGVEPMKAAYAHAIKSGYRFYSYGDACLLERADDQ